jgi:NADPH:quinone reductase-like Zn-dependent oxidoreductase
MKAVRFHQHGDPDVLRYEDAPAPTPQEGWAIVRVRACALNHLDLWERRGIDRVRLPLPHISGSDVAGEVVDPGGAPVPHGARVLLYPGLSCGACSACVEGRENLCGAFDVLGLQSDGGYAEYVKVPAGNLVPIPDDVDLLSAAAFPLTFLTAWHMLVTLAKVREGPSKMENTRALGAEEVFDHYADDFSRRVKASTAGRGVDIVIEHVGEATWERSVRSLARGGRLVTCGATTGAQATLDLRHLFARQLSLIGSYMGTRRELREAATHFFAGRLKPVIDSALPLAQAREAHQRLEAREHFGKIVLKV